MEIEQGIRTQQLKLLRIVAGLLLVVAFACSVPFSAACRRWVRNTVFSVLTRAEAAVQNLVAAQAAVLARQHGLRFDSSRLFAAASKPYADDAIFEAALPTSRALRRRLTALLRVLRNLPRHGLRLLRRMRAAQAPKQVPANEVYALPLQFWRLALTPPERPPDQTGLRFRDEFLSLPPEVGREAQALA